MLLPLFEDCLSEAFKVEDEGKEDVHFDLILSVNDFFELVKGEFVQSETDEIGEDREESTIVFAVGAAGEFGEDGVVGDFQKCAIALAAIENLFHEDAFGIFAFERGEKLFGMGVWSHFVLIEGVDEFDAFFDQLRIFHLFFIM